MEYGIVPIELLNKISDTLDEVRSLLKEERKSAETSWMKSKEVKKKLTCSDSTLKNYRDQGQIEFKKIGKTYYYNLDRIVRKHNNNE